MSYIEKIISSLDRIDWDFPNSGTGNNGVHALHAFPGNSIPQIPSSFVQILSKMDDVVFDPFGGSGTTAIEALRLGRNAISSDILSASVLAMQGKVSAFTTSSLSELVNSCLSDLTWDHICESDKGGLNGEGENFELTEWYHPRTLRQMKFIWGLIEKSEKKFHAILKMLFADTLFSCASTQRSRTASGLIRRHHWGWVADNVKPVEPLENNAVDIFRKRLVQLLSIPSYQKKDNNTCFILRQNACSLALANNSVDLVVTSPPYVGVIDYARANRLLYLWNNWNLDRDRHVETGARFKRGRKTLKADYLSEMTLCWEEISRVLKPGAFCAVVIGESRSYPGTVSLALESMSQYLVPIWGEKQRIPSRRRVSDRSAQDAIEYLMVWQKQ